MLVEGQASGVFVTVAGSAVVLALSPALDARAMAAALALGQVVALLVVGIRTARLLPSFRPSVFRVAGTALGVVGCAVAGALVRSLQEPAAATLALVALATLFSLVVAVRRRNPYRITSSSG